MSTRDADRGGADPLHLVADAVIARRRALRMSKEAAARAAGISSITWKRVEDGLPVRDVNYAAVEVALGWAAGSIDRVGRGGEPVVEGEAPPADEVVDPIAQAIAADPALSDHARRTILELVELYRRAEPGGGATNRHRLA